MTKILKSLSISAFTTLILFVNKAFAQSAGFFSGENANPEGIATVAKGTFGGNVVTVINYFLGLLGLIAVAFLIYAGILMVTAGGAEEQVGKGKKIITYAVAGIVIILLSYTIVSFVSQALNK